MTCHMLPTVTLAIALAGAASGVHATSSISAFRLLGASGLAQTESQTEKETTPPADPLPDLDDLLGLPGRPPAVEGAEGEDAESPAGRRIEQELERKLSAVELADKFREAIEEMGQLADRLERARDTGLETQRLHEEVIRKLDALIKNSRSSSSSSSSGSGSSSSSSSSSAPNQPKAGQQQQQQDQAGSGTNQSEAMPPPMQSPELRGRLDVTRAAWGALPERIRESLMQGSSDQFSSLYEALTEEYYRRLAEEARP